MILGRDIGSVTVILGRDIGSVTGTNFVVCSPTENFSPVDRDEILRNTTTMVERKFESFAAVLALSGLL